MEWISLGGNERFLFGFMEYWMHQNDSIYEATHNIRRKNSNIGMEDVICKSIQCEMKILSTKDNNDVHAYKVKSAWLNSKNRNSEKHKPSQK